MRVVKTRNLSNINVDSFLKVFDNKFVSLSSELSDVGNCFSYASNSAVIPALDTATVALSNAVLQSFN